VPQRTLPAGTPRLLIVEDELLIALCIKEMARDIGYDVSGVVHTVPLARKKFAKRNFDAVLLDISFDGQFSFEFADLLLEAKIPFAFITGYDYLVEPRHELVPILQKPFTLAQLRVLLATLVGPPSLNEHE
jgi:CheY-like chemotaxis protein